MTTLDYILLTVVVLGGLLFFAVMGLLLWLGIRHMVSLRREVKAQFDAEQDMAEADDDDDPEGLGFEVKRETANFLYLESLKNGNRRFLYKGDPDSDEWMYSEYAPEPVDRFWVETGVWSMQFTSPLED